MKIIFAFLFLFIPATLIAQVEKEIKEGIKLYKSGKLDEAKSILEDLADDEVMIDSLYYYLGLIYFEEKEYGDAEDYLLKAVELNSNQSSYHYHLGKAYLFDARESNIFSQMSLLSRAKKSFYKALKLDPNNIDARIYLANYLYQAPGIAGGDTEEAIKQAEIILKTEKKQGHLLLAQIYQGEEEFGEALKEFEELEKCCGSDTSIYYFYNNYGYLLLNQNKIEEAISKFKRQVELAPNNANAHDSLGDGYLAAGKKELAKEQFQIALKLDPDLESSREKLEELEDD